VSEADIFFFELEFKGNRSDCGSGKEQYAFFPFIFEGSALPGIRCCISSRFEADMVYSLYRDLGITGKRVYGPRQSHSRNVLALDEHEDDRADRGPLSADGLLTARRDAVLFVTVADCLPVFLYDAETGVFGALHSGWKGTGIAVNALTLMKERWGVRPESVAAVLGPCICSRCYRVDGERALSYEAEFGGPGPYPLGPVVKKTGDGEESLDMQAANSRLLAAAGVRNIAVCGNCTFEDKRLGSFRREGNAYTRMAALAGFFL
jgi:YfiH family protein